MTARWFKGQMCQIKGFASFIWFTVFIIIKQCCTFCFWNRDLSWREKRSPWSHNFPTSLGAGEVTVRVTHTSQICKLVPYMVALFAYDSLSKSWLSSPDNLCKCILHELNAVISSDLISPSFPHQIFFCKFNLFEVNAVISPPHRPLLPTIKCATTCIHILKSLK